MKIELENLSLQQFIDALRDGDFFLVSKLPHFLIQKYELKDCGLDTLLPLTLFTLAETDFSIEDITAIEVLNIYVETPSSMLLKVAAEMLIAYREKLSTDDNNLATGEMINAVIQKKFADIKKSDKFDSALANCSALTIDTGVIQDKLQNYQNDAAVKKYEENASSAIYLSKILFEEIQNLNQTLDDYISFLDNQQKTSPCNTRTIRLDAAKRIKTSLASTDNLDNVKNNFAEQMSVILKNKPDLYELGLLGYIQNVLSRLIPNWRPPAVSITDTFIIDMQQSIWNIDTSISSTHKAPLA